jgi:hypothetical protein
MCIEATSAEPTSAEGELAALAEGLLKIAGRTLAEGDYASISSGELASVLTSAMKLYAAKAEAEGQLPAPISAERLTPTEVVLTVTEMLRACNLNLFDLAMWYRRAR